MAKLKNMTAEEKILNAKGVIESLVNLTSQVIEIHEINQHLTYSKKLAEKVPRSNAVHAYNALGSAMYQFELLRLIALWEGIDEDKPSLPRVIALIDDAGVIAKLKSYEYDLHSQSRSPGPKLEQWAEDIVANNQVLFGRQQARKLSISIRHSIRTIKAVESDPRLVALRNIRDKHIAHNLYQTRIEKAGKVLVKTHYGYEGELLRKTLALIEKLYLWVNGIDLDVSRKPRRKSKQNAAALWKNIVFF